jgi:putative FmdB family regulatory protein
MMAKTFIEEEKHMPIYDYRCDNCAKTFSVTLSMAEHDKGKIACPGCKDDKVVQLYSTFYAKTSKKS